MSERSAPFSNFAQVIRPRSPLRQAITAAYRRPEPECVASLISGATLPDGLHAAVRATASTLVLTQRAKPRRGGVEALIHEYALSSQEGVALMCLAEALLRVPDNATRDALIRDKIAAGDWKSHLGAGRPLFVNAASWGLIVTGKLSESVDDRGLAAALTRLIARVGEPIVRRAVDLAMRMMGEQFVTGETIGAALKRARVLEAKGFSYSYDMLGEAATTAANAARYCADYERAIQTIGVASGGRGIYAGPGISIKLSALHPRYARAQAARVMNELLPRVKALAALARSHDIGFSIDAEEADRLEISLDLLESLALDPDLAGWNGLGFVVQAYGKRCPFVIDWIIELAQRAGRRIMVRLVKGAYWDTEIKRAQVDGLADYPVYTRKVHTDVAYIACARKLLAAPGAVFPQFATHNAQTLATVYHMAGAEFEIGQYEFQCLHGMGEPIYEQVVRKLERPCRIYAPVGTHQTLLAYLVRRLLENGANSSFVNRIADAAISLDELVTDPVDMVRAMPELGAKHDQISLPADLYGARRNSAGIDLTDEAALAALSAELTASAAFAWTAEPIIADSQIKRRQHDVRNPADPDDIVGVVALALERDAACAAKSALATARGWAAAPLELRAGCLERAADAMQARMPVLIGLIVREAGKSVPGAISEVREAIDFLRYYAARARLTIAPDTRALGPVVCISPWNFPLAIFAGQIAAALVAGNPVLAKPAEETPLIAAEAVRILHAAGIPQAALQFLPGDGRIGAALVAAPEIAGVMFTGSIGAARQIHAELSKRLSADSNPISLIAETGGQNAMVVDSSALAEQVVSDVIASAFDSAGQRCSALRVLCLQDEIADPMLDMLKGTLKELSIGRPDRLDTDIGPVITAAAKANIVRHVELMRDRGCVVEQIDLPDETVRGCFVPPTIIEIANVGELEREVFGPVLHVLRYRREQLDALIDDINATGYGLTFGLHTRLDETIAHVRKRIRAGNVYINRNVIGAVVGVQPFGGCGLSGTGPKAGGPLYLRRLVRNAPQALGFDCADPALLDFAAWLEYRGEAAAATIARQYGATSPLCTEIELSGPVGERNLYALHPRGRILLKPVSKPGLYQQVAAVLAAGCHAVIDAEYPHSDMPASVAARLSKGVAGRVAGALIEGDDNAILAAAGEIAALDGAFVMFQSASPRQCREAKAYNLEWLLEETSTSINTTAAGGNARLMMIY
jgi:RHH-type proline utilization regulon transcriptional repressor/proline dehydrogenase/delta 1-pyrroline-5-carboxylate dehydrogenase